MTTAVLPRWDDDDLETGFVGLSSPSQVRAPAAVSARPKQVPVDWLEGHARVLALAQDEQLPLRERVEYVALFSSLLDEFFLGHVAPLRQHSSSATEELAVLSRRAHQLVAAYASALHDDLLPALERVGVSFVGWHQLSASEHGRLHAMFAERIHPLLTPLAVDSAHPFPRAGGLSLTIAVRLRDRGSSRERFACVPLRSPAARLLPVNEGRVVRLEDVVVAHLPGLFSGLQVLEAGCFRVTRSITNPWDDPPVRLEVEQAMSARLRDVVVDAVGVADGDIYRVRGSLELGSAVAGLLRQYGAVDARPDENATLRQTTRPFVSNVTVAVPALAQ